LLSGFAVFGKSGFTDYHERGALVKGLSEAKETKEVKKASLIKKTRKPYFKLSGFPDKNNEAIIRLRDRISLVGSFELSI
jgi:hypothetical protein